VTRDGSRGLMRYQFEEIYNALNFSKDDINLTGTHGLQTKADAYALLKNMCDFKFICSIIIWYDKYIIILNRLLLTL
jgi:hypothetical protein